MNECDNLTFSKVIKEVYKIYDEIVIVAKADDSVKILSPIAKNIVAIIPFTNDIRIVSQNIDSVKNAYQNAQIALKNADISTKAKEASIQKAQEALGSANSAHLSALFAGERAEFTNKATAPILDNLEIIKLSPINAQIAKESSDIATRAKNASIQKAQEALDSSKSAHLSALFASAKEENIETISVEIEGKRVEILGKIDKHNNFMTLSKQEIESIRDVLLQNSLEAKIARDEAVESAIEATKAKNEVKSNVEFIESTVPVVRQQTNDAISASSSAKKYRDSVEDIAEDVKTKSTAYLNEGREYRDETKEMYEALKDVDGVYDIKKEIYALRTGMLYEIRGDVLRP